MDLLGIGLLALGLLGLLGLAALSLVLSFVVRVLEFVYLDFIFVMELHINCASVKYPEAFDP